MNKMSYLGMELRANYSPGSVEGSTWIGDKRTITLSPPWVRSFGAVYPDKRQKNELTWKWDHIEKWFNY